MRAFAVSIIATAAIVALAGCQHGGDDDVALPMIGEVVVALNCSPDAHPRNPGDWYGGLTCTGAQVTVFAACRPGCPGPAPACIAACLEGHTVGDGNYWCPCDGSPCFIATQQSNIWCPP